ncbi:MAG: hypothetical protein ACI4JY_08805, partial [Oscillospiraceae bacterium]
NPSGIGLPFTSKYSPVEPAGIVIVLGFDPLDGVELLEGLRGFGVELLELEELEELLDGSRGFGVDVVEL